MISPNSEPNREQGTIANQAFSLIQALDSERHVTYTAIDQIKGAALAKEFLKGYANSLEANATPEEPIENPLEAAMTDITHSANDYVMGILSSNSAAIQYGIIMKLWNTAYGELADQT